MSHKTRLLHVSALTLLLLWSSTQAVAGDQVKPSTELTSEFVYKYLTGEIAGQRGNAGLASALFLDLAKSSRDARLAERAMQAAAYAQQPRLALQAASLWSELEPESDAARQATSQLLLGAGRLADAQPLLQKMLAPEETRGTGFLYLNGVLSRHPDKAASLKLIQTLAKPYPDQPEAHFAIAHGAWAAEKTELALSELHKADQLYPGWELAAMLRAEILQHSSPAEADRFLQSFLEQYPGSNDVRLSYAKLLASQKKYDEARTLFAPLLDQNPDSPEIATIAGLLSLELGEFAQADTYFKQALDHNPASPERLYLYMGESAERQKKPEQALEWYALASMGDRYLEAQMRSATVLADQGKLTEARELLHNLPEETSSEDRATAMQFEASLLMRARQYQAAYDTLEQAITTLPNTPDIIYDFAMAAEKVQRYDIMEKQLRTLIKLTPDSAQAYNALGYTLADRNERLGEAAKLIEKALSLKPNDHYILDSMGWVHYRLGKLEQAADYLQRAYDKQTDPEIAAHLGEVLWQLGKREEAARTWDNALRHFPDNELLVNTSKKFPR